MKKSNYNFTFKINKKNKKYTVLFNSLYGSITLLPKSLQESMSDKKSIDTLIKNRHLIDDNLNEIDLIRSQNKLQRFNERTLELTILPTLWCNLKCIYCYEGDNKKKKVMTDKDIETIYLYICSKIKKINALSLLWFGGEPLLETNKIKKLSKKLISFTEKNNVKFSNSIITNATLLNKENRKALLEAGINDMQITLDGPPDIHNKRKPSLNGSGTFDIILKNLIDAVDDLKISIRINIDKTNIDRVKDLIDILSLHNLQNKLYVYVAKIENIGGACESIGGACLDEADFLNTEKKILEYMDKKGFQKISTPSYRINYCTADNNHSFTILPDMDVHKCWHLVDNSKETVGKLVNNKIKFNHNIYKWLAYDPIDNKKCRKCKYIPLCMGGCPKIKITEGKNRCDALKNSIKRFIEKELTRKGLI